MADSGDDPPATGGRLRGLLLVEGAVPAAGPGEQADWAELRLDRVTLDDTDMPRSDLTDIVVTRCDWANVQAHSSSWRRMRFEGCRLTGLGLGEAGLRDVTFSGCRLDLANLRFAKLERVAFEGCELDDVELLGAQLKDVTFTDCRFGEAELSRMECQRVHLRGCTLDRVKGLTSLKGTAMPWTDLVGLAGAMATALGIRSLDD
jgi:uncharacterized protein YjbI with pentapeptide repeats